jgi:inner membrane protein
MALAAEAPDLDMLGQFKDPVFGFAHHRGFTHSFLGLFLMSGLVVGFMYLIWHLRGRKASNSALPPRWGLLFVYAYLAGLTHILLDFTNNYGVRPFWPFSEKWYSWDIVFIADPFLWLVLVAGLLVPTFFSLVDRELGVRPKVPAGRIGATLALFGVLAVWGVRDYQHRRAVNALKAYVYEKAEPIRASAYPNWWNPFAWNGVVETRNFYATTLVDSLQPEVDPNAEMQIVYKPEETPITLAAKNSRLGHVYLDWAQYPVAETEAIQTPQPGYIVHFIDLRYGSPQFGVKKSLSAGVELNGNLHVVAEIFGHRRRSLP